LYLSKVPARQLPGDVSLVKARMMRTAERARRRENGAESLLRVTAVA